MADELFPGFPASPNTQSPGSSNGGQITPRDVNNYKPPVGPSSINNPQSPGLHGDNHGNCVNQGKH